MKGSKLKRAMARLAVAGALAGLAGAAGAQGPGEPGTDNQARRLEPIVVTATRMEEKASEQASAVSIVTRDAIELASPSLAGDVLRGLPGVVVQRAGSPGGLENIKIRGGKSTHTLVLIDGFPVNSPTLGEFDVGSLPPDGFERIEIVRGAQSALYGSNAMGGVVNFIPRKGEGRQYGAGLGGGSFETLQWKGFAQGGGRGGNYFLGASGFRSDGILPNDGAEIASLLGTGEVIVNPKNRLNVIALSTDATKGVPIDFGDPQDLTHVNVRRGRMAGARWEYAPTGFLSLTAHGHVFDEKFDVNDPDPGSLFGFDSLTKTRKSTGGIEARVSSRGISTTFLGFEYGKDRATNFLTWATGILPASFIADSILNRSFYLQEELRPAKGAGISLGARVDRNSVAKTQFNPRGAAFYAFEPIGVKLRAAVGRGFRAPTILEKTDPDAGTFSLTSESALSYEAGVDYALPGRKGTVSGTWFYQEFRDMIQFDTTTFRLANIDALARGLEVEAGYRLIPELGISVAYTGTDTWDKTLQQRVLGVPKHQGAAALLLDPLPGWQGRIDWRVESDQLDSQLFSGRKRRPGFAVVDLSTRYRWELREPGIREIALTGRVGNLLNRRYEERLDVPAPGINFLVGAEARI